VPAAYLATHRVERDYPGVCLYMARLYMAQTV